MDEDTRGRVLVVAEQQLVASPHGDIATRAVCEAAGITQPVLYRLFGDKQGLLDALAERGLARYAQDKSELEATDDPIADLRQGWVGHMEFAERNPALYRLMFGTHQGASSFPMRRIYALLAATLERCAAIGALSISVDEAAQSILAANIGVALTTLSQPAIYRDPHLSMRVRDAVLATVLTVPTPSARDGDPLVHAARQMRAQLALSNPRELIPEERALLVRWLERLSAP